MSRRIPVWDEPEKWVPMPGEDLHCDECRSANTRKIKLVEGRGSRKTKRDILHCNDCGHASDRWNRQKGNGDAGSTDG